MVQTVGGPGRVLVLTNESLFELAQRAEDDLPHHDLHIVGLAGERILRIQKKSPLQWIEDCYQNTAETVSYAS